MPSIFVTSIRETCGLVACLAMLFVGTGAVHGQSPSAYSTAGRIDFGVVNLPPATVEIDLNHDLLTDVLGLGDAAIQGVIESLQRRGESHEGSAAMGLAAEKLTEGKELLGLVSDVVYEARVRIYEDLSEGDETAEQLAARFNEQLKDSKWQRVLKVRDGDESAQVSLMRIEGAILGVFAVLSEGNDVVMVNVVGNVSPENVKKLTAAATKIALENGLHKEIEREMMRHIK